MDNRNHELSNLFDNYADTFNRSIKDEKPDIEGTAISFADCFIEANPLGVNCGRNDEQSMAMIPQDMRFIKTSE